MTVSYDAKTSSYGTLLVSHGAHVFTWRPTRAGLWTITLTAVDLAGNRQSQTLAVTVAPGHGH
jgi:hypothetical protein